MAFKYFKAHKGKSTRSLRLTPAKAGLDHLNFRYEKCAPKESIFLRSHGHEVLINLLSGMVEIICGEKSYRLGPRKSVFNGPSHAFYCGSDNALLLKALQSSEIIIVKVPRTGNQGVRHITPREIRKRRVGCKTYLRSVHDIIHEHDNAAMLLAGETFNAPGKWSSFPPHKHDRERMPSECKLEEIYFFKVKPENKFGMIRLYGERQGRIYDECHVINNNDCVAIPFGYHPVCAAPDTELYYFWALAGKKRKLRCSPDRNYL